MESVTFTIKLLKPLNITKRYKDLNQMVTLTKYKVARQNEIQVALDNLKIEFEQFEKFYPDAPKYLFDYNERALLGFFTNALIRNNNQIQTIQEYSVWSGTEETIYKSEGRADLLVMIEGNPRIQILFEAKKWVFDGKKYSKEVFRNEMKFVLDQNISYYKAEEQSFNKNDKHYIATVIFEKIDEELIKDYPTTTCEDFIDYYSLYRFSNDGHALAVYGQITKSAQ
jgi:hypothetical protein